MRSIGSTAVALALTLAPIAFAQTYIVPEGDCGAVTLDLTRDAGFAKTAEPISADSVETAVVNLPKQRVPANVVEGPRSLTFNADVPKEGVVVMAAAALKPAVLGNETRTEHAKAFVYCGAAPKIDWQRSTGLGLEIYPQGWNGPRPNMKAGDTMRFIAVAKATNTLLRDLPMELYRAGTGLVASGEPAEYGGMNFPFPEPGRYTVVATYRRPDPQQKDRVLVDTSTLTFDVK